MSQRWIVVLIAVFGLVLTGCGSDKAAVSTPTAKSSAEQSDSAEEAEDTAAESTEEETASDAPLEQLSVPECADAYSAKLDLILAGNSDEAKPPADTLSGFNPPADVQEALDHFVDVGGVQFDDTEYDEMNNRIDEWLAQICPQ